jgi:hypothetical protein
MSLTQSSACNVPIVVLPLLWGLMYIASYNINSTDQHVEAKEQRMYSHILIFGYVQFVMGYVTGLVMLAVKVKLRDMEKLPYVELKAADEPA